MSEDSEGTGLVVSSQLCVSACVSSKKREDHKTRASSLGFQW